MLLWNLGPFVVPCFLVVTPYSVRRFFASRRPFPENSGDHFLSGKEGFLFDSRGWQDRWRLVCWSVCVACGRMCVCCTAWRMRFAVLSTHVRMYRWILHFICDGGIVCRFCCYNQHKVKDSIDANPLSTFACPPPPQLPSYKVSAQPPSPSIPLSSPSLSYHHTLCGPRSVLFTMNFFF